MLVLEILFELLLEIFGSIFLETSLAATHALDSDKGAKVPAAFLFLVLGFVFGALSVFLAPARLLPATLFPGVSLFVTPLVLSLTMEGWGRLRSSRTRNVSHLGTWYGGAALGIGFAGGRLVGLAFAADVAAL